MLSENTQSCASPSHHTDIPATNQKPLQARYRHQSADSCFTCSQPFGATGNRFSWWEREKTWSCAQACLSSIYMYERASLHTSAAPHMQLSAAVIDQQRSFSETSHPSWQPSTMLFLSLLYTHLTYTPALSSQVRMRLSPGLAVSVIALNEHGKP